ncbi:hypothetical protein SUGI_0497370 [Cryptomeria japonica]|uniref:uncharacterized protein LOC131875909 n=1 Tax=Cryptomeria japonica TaxID=3369 RepID=UPI002408E32C|nr:uncharacterized protein LOC131875909 [Cryptomeria japonica]GLJ25946.1 hypothetical protein SUGI_0497370 [Cryptomeria japonica]
MGLIGEILVWHETHLDMILVPAGLLMFAVYNGCLLHTILTHPHTTFIGINAIHRRAWVEAITKEGMKQGILAVQTIRNGMMAATLMASTTIVLCSVIGLLLGARLGGSLSEFTLYGMSGSLTSCVKCMMLLLSLLAAFLCHVQCVHYYSHVSFLITIPPATPEMQNAHVEYVSRAFNKGAHFWSVGLIAFNLSLALFMWNFGPIPMFVSSCLLLLFQHSLDRPITNLGVNYPNYPEQKERARSLSELMGIPRGFL